MGAIPRKNSGCRKDTGEGCRFQVCKRHAQHTGGGLVGPPAKAGPSSLAAPGTRVSAHPPTGTGSLLGCRGGALAKTYSSTAGSRLLDGPAFPHVLTAVQHQGTFLTEPTRVNSLVFHFLSASLHSCLHVSSPLPISFPLPLSFSASKCLNNFGNIAGCFKFILLEQGKGWVDV